MSGAGDGCMHVMAKLTKHVYVCVCVSDNRIGAAGGAAVAKALKVNTTVQKINLTREWCW